MFVFCSRKMAKPKDQSSSNMFAAEGGRAAAPRCRKAPSRLQDSRRRRQPLALLGRPIEARLPGGSGSTRHQHGVSLSMPTQLFPQQQLCGPPPPPPTTPISRMKGTSNAAEWAPCGEHGREDGPDPEHLSTSLTLMNVK